MTVVTHVEGRWWGSTSASIAAHAALFALMMLIATRVTQISDAPRSGELSLVYLAGAGLGSGSGGGGDTDARPARPAVIKRTSAASAPASSDAAHPPALVPAITANAVDTVPGTTTAIDPSAMAVGEGEGHGGGGGRRGGNGDGDGLGHGRVAGLGDGDIYQPGNGVSNPLLVREVKPNYTADALRAKIQGTVEMQAVVRADGTIDPRSIRIVRSLDPTFGLDREAVEAVKKWRFSPAMRKGQPVAVLVTLELAFTLR